MYECKVCEVTGTEEELDDHLQQEHDVHYQQTHIMMKEIAEAK